MGREDLEDVPDLCCSGGSWCAISPEDEIGLEVEGDHPRAAMPLDLGRLQAREEFFRAAGAGFFVWGECEDMPFGDGCIEGEWR